ncbi:hypothetical protein KAR91_47390 [Candidatus Pacearchaeota archaeon]|nr:hypothetical protein [Candidatus Pacearchaeota archaeon]
MNGKEAENCGHMEQYKKDFYEQAKVCNLVTKRDRSSIYKVKWNDKFYCWKILVNDDRFSYTYEQSYKNYEAIKDKSNLVNVCSIWRDVTNRFNVLMEWLDGYSRLEYSNRSPKVLEKMNAIEQGLIDEGYFMIDLAPINFMSNRSGDIKMIDLDTLARLDHFPVDPHKMISELSWYGSRILKHRSGRVR